MIPRVSLCQAVACLLLASLSAVPVEAAKTSLVPVTGRVIDADTGKGVAGALVGVYQSGLKAVKADSQGRFRVLGMPGAKRIVYYGGGNPLYRSDSDTYVTADLTSKGTSGVILPLIKVRSAHGKVFMPSGMPLAGADVTIGGDYFTHAVTDSKGKFKIEVPGEQSKPGG